MPLLVRSGTSSAERRSGRHLKFANSCSMISRRRRRPKKGEKSNNLGVFHWIEGKFLTRGRPLGLQGGLQTQLFDGRFHSFKIARLIDSSWSWHQIG